MADSTDHLPEHVLAAKCLTEMAELVEIILQNVPGKCLAAAAQVCRLWNVTIRRIRNTRRNCLTTIFPLRFFNEFSNISQFFNTVTTEAQAALIFSIGQVSCSDITVKKMLSTTRQGLAKGCVLVGSSVTELVGTNRHSCATDGQSSVCHMCMHINTDYKLNLKRRPGIGIVLIPRFQGVHARGFYVPLRNKYESISGIGHFLPDMTLPVKLVIVLAHPLSLGKLTKFVGEVRKKYGDEVVVVGGYSESRLYYQSNVTSREIVGLVFCGHMSAASVVIPCGSNPLERQENLHAGFERLAMAAVPLRNATSLMFSPSSNSREDPALTGEKASTVQAFKQRFPNVPLLGIIGPAAYGCDTVQLKIDGVKAGGRDYQHREAIVVCLFSFTV